MGRLDGKVFVITGTSSGMGRAMAIQFAKEGARLVISDINPNVPEGNYVADPDMRPTEEVIKSLGGEVVYTHCDVTRQEDVKNLIKTAVDRFGKITNVVANAGIWRGGVMMHHEPVEYLDEMYAVNVKGPYLTCQEAIKQFLRQDSPGNIVVICSSTSLAIYPSECAYCMTKSALPALVKAIALEYGPKGIRINGICPTWVKTTLSHALYEDEAKRHAVEMFVPLRKWCDVGDVANLATFLSTEESSFIHGALIPVDGGNILSLGEVPSAFIDWDYSVDDEK
jgi:NAD(P)-dependent dehydrogenase (short-subunit alcohol dehydrogenase family)